MRRHDLGKEPAVSVVVPLCGLAAGVGATCLSVVEQDFRDIELLAVDDGRLPGLTDVLRRWLTGRVRILDAPGIDAAEAKLVGLAASAGRLLTCIMPGMVMAPGWLREASARLGREPRADLVRGWRYVYDGRRGLLNPAVPRSFVRDPVKHLRRDPSICLADVVVRRECWSGALSADNVDESIRMRTLLHSANVTALDHPTVWTPHDIRRRPAALLAAERFRQAFLPPRRAA
jgi:hypothetical protein